MTHRFFSLIRAMLFPGLLGLTGWGYSQPAETLPPLRLDFAWVVASGAFGAYTADLPELRERAIEATPDFDLRISYALSPRYRVGLSYTGHGYRHKVAYIEADRVGTQLLDPNRNYQLFSYTDTENWRTFQYQHWGLYGEVLLVDQLPLGLSLRLGAQGLRLQQRDYFLPMYQGQTIESDILRSTEWVPGLEAGLVGAFRLNPVVALTASGTYVQSLTQAPVPGGGLYHYAHASLGLQLGLETRPEAAPPAERKNTLMLGLGWPLSLSYERLLWEGNMQHSLRAFLDQYLIYETLLGGAYNVKVGQDRHFFLAEALFFVPEYLHAGLVLGYVYQGPSGLVLRADAGLTTNQMGLGDNMSPVYPRGQVHVGYAF
ncbi:MAG: hypothetical protein D6722_13725 [Bacteroidetes bacterium]|nr:MAG: hypothetical protein D6722_13725 [Bacteroidota bacterium]